MNLSPLILIYQLFSYFVLNAKHNNHVFAVEITERTSYRS